MTCAVRALLSLCLLIGMIGTSSAKAEELLTVFVAASAAKPVELAIPSFERKHDVQVRVSAAASSVLARQLAAGAPAHLYISANPDWMNWASDKRLIAEATRTDLMGNRLVVVTQASRDLPKDLREALTTAAGAGRIAVADPDHVPVGMYARAALEKLGLWKTLSTRLARSADARGTIVFVARGEVAAGIAYATDALLSQKVRIANEIPVSAHAPIIYQAAVVKEGDSKLSRALLAHLLRPESQAIFETHGFVGVRSQ